MAQILKVSPEATNNLASGNNNGTGSSNSVSPQPTVRRKRVVSPIYVDARRAMKKFMSLPSIAQNTENKRACVDMVLSTSKFYGDPARFWTDLQVEADRLDRAKDLLEYCEKNRLNAKAVKQHLILEGKMAVNDVILNGIRKCAPKLRMFGHLLYDEERELPSTRMEDGEAEAKSAAVKKAEGLDE